MPQQTEPAEDSSSVSAEPGQPGALDEPSARGPEFGAAPGSPPEALEAGAPQSKEPPGPASPDRSEEQASPATVQQAIDQVNHIIATLRESLEEMEEVLEMLEVLERQTGTDEREIESLRRALRQLQRSRQAPQQHRGR